MFFRRNPLSEFIRRTDFVGRRGIPLSLGKEGSSDVYLRWFSALDNNIRGFQCITLCCKKEEASGTPCKKSQRQGLISLQATHWTVDWGTILHYDNVTLTWISSCFANWKRKDSRVDTLMKLLNRRAMHEPRGISVKRNLWIWCKMK